MFTLLTVIFLLTTLIPYTEILVHNINNVIIPTLAISSVMARCMQNKSNIWKYLYGLIYCISISFIIYCVYV